MQGLQKLKGLVYVIDSLLSGGAASGRGCCQVLVGAAGSNISSLRGMATMYNTPSPNPVGPPAFCFDIDGVLIRGKQVLPAALKAMSKLCPSGRWQYPCVFLTNGGGTTETKKAEQLSEWLQVPVAPTQVVLSHSPMRELVPRFSDQPVLVSGRGQVVQVAHEYGFKRVMHTNQLAELYPAAVPFIRQTLQHQLRIQIGRCAQVLGSDCLAAACDATHDGSLARDLGTEEHPFRAVMVMSDPSNWYVDLQIIIDVLASRGSFLRKEAPPGAPPVELYFSNPDLLWANEHPRNRFGQGAFAHIVLSLYKEMMHLNHVDFPVKFYGKPNPEPYRLAEKLLTQQARDLGLLEPPGLQHRNEAYDQLSPFCGIFAVGDNPRADVRGANAAGSPWISTLVQTGVFSGPGLNCSVDTAQISVQDVCAAVDAALHRSRMLRWHGMR